MAEFMLSCLIHVTLGYHLAPYIRHFAKDIMSALLSADAALTYEERNNLLAQEQAFEKQLREVRAKLGHKICGPYPQLIEALNVPQNPKATSTTEDMEPPTAEELKPSKAEIAGYTILDYNDAEHYRKVSHSRHPCSTTRGNRKHWCCFARTTRTFLAAIKTICRGAR